MCWSVFLRMYRHCINSWWQHYECVQWYIQHRLVYVILQISGGTDFSFLMMLAESTLKRIDWKTPIGVQLLDHSIRQTSFIIIRSISDFICPMDWNMSISFLHAFSIFCSYSSAIYVSASEKKSSQISMTAALNILLIWRVQTKIQGESRGMCNNHHCLLQCFFTKFAKSFVLNPALYLCLLYICLTINEQKWTW